MIRNVTLAAGLVVGLATAANADYSFSQSADQAPTYSTTLNFDEPGGPTGVVD